MTIFSIEHIDDLAKIIFEQNKAVGWWDDMNRCIYTTIQLIVTEIAEATEGERKNLMDDHLPHRKMGEVELADGLIRTLDIGGRFSHVLSFAPALAYCNYEEDTAEAIDDYAQQSPAKCHLSLVRFCIEFANAYHDFYHNLLDSELEAVEQFNERYLCLVSAFYLVSEALNYDIFGAMEEKLAYNKQRAIKGDHSREARAEKHGKKF